MPAKTHRQFFVIYACIVAFDLIGLYIEKASVLHYFAKPLILLSLLVFFAIHSKMVQKPIRVIISLALLFSWFGDLFLMFDEQQPYFFKFGLGAFLIAHVMYIIGFIKQKGGNTQVFPFIGILSLYAIALFYVIKDGLGELLIPVIIYMGALLTMGVCAFLRTKTNSIASYQLILIGAILFMISDSLLALNMFYKPFALASFGIMITYALAQLFIVVGILKHAHFRSVTNKL